MLFTSYKYALFVGGRVLRLLRRHAAVARPPAPEPRAARAQLRLLRLWDWRWCLLLAGRHGDRLPRRPAARRAPARAAASSSSSSSSSTSARSAPSSTSASSPTRSPRCCGGVGLHADWVTLHLVLPVGISYYVFQNLSYVIDVYRRDVAGDARRRRVRHRAQLLPAAPGRPDHAAPRPAAAALRAPHLRRRPRPRRPAPGALGPDQEDAHRRQHRRAGRLRLEQHRAPGRRLAW